jgi:hypothetical protein
VTYRDDRDALLARNDALEAENERLRDELDEAKHPPKPAEPAPAAKPAEPAPVAKPKPVSPAATSKSKRRLHRPTWVIVLGILMTATYAFVTVELLVTLALGDDPLAVPRGAWFPGCFAPLFGFGWAIPTGLGMVRHSHENRTPRWLNYLIVLHWLYAIGMFIGTATGHVAQLYALQATAAAFLSIGVVGTWYGEWTDR